MVNKIKILTFLLVSISLPAFSQEFPPIQNFYPSDYKAQNQNWSISQDSDKIIYVANNEGLLEYNGANWSLYPSPNETIMRSVHAIDEKIYTGCYMEFGFWERNEFGVLNYTSISNELKVELNEDEEFWNIVNYDDWIIFQSLQRIYIYNSSNEATQVIEAKNEIVNMFLLNNSIYYQERGHGIFRVINGRGTLLTDDTIFKVDEVINMFSTDKGYLFLTRNNGFHWLIDNQLKEWFEANKQIFTVYSGIKTSNGDFAIGTISNGLIHLSKSGDVLNQFNQDNSLINNTVLSVFEDTDHNFWAGLDNGISLINIQASIKVFRDIEGTLGSVYTTAIHENNLYLGTNQGLYFKPRDEDVPFQFVNGTDGQVWSLRLLNNILFCGHHKGTFTISDNRASLISDIQGAWDFVALNENRILQGNYDGLYVLERAGNSWKLQNKLKGFNNSSRHFAVDQHQIFVNHEYKGVFQLAVDDSFTEVTHVQMDTILKSANSSITSYKDQVFYGYKHGILSYQNQSKRFERDSALSKLYDESNFLSGNIIISEPNDEFWLFMKDKLTRVSFDNLVDLPKLTSVPLNYDTRQEVTEFENAIHLTNNTYLFGTTYGYITIDLDDPDDPDFSIVISSINNGINQDHSVSTNLINKEESKDFGTDENNLSFNFHTSSYQSYYQPYYQYRLVGIYDKWSEWSTSSSVFYENLPPGKYEFNVRSKVGNKLSQNIASYKFSIAKPWYATNLMIALYVIGVLGFSVFMHNVYRAYYKRQHQKLIERNQRELELTKLQNEKEIMELKNDQLKKENKSKSNELAASTMSIIKKNELLNQIKEQLARVGDVATVKPVIKTIDKNLNQGKNWELFQEAFNNADRDFFKNLTEVHPDLSPNDLKLCAYLRLNLSSKEIAGLINISPRSVEVKRYRLRKKLGLDNNENLANYIIGI